MLLRKGSRCFENFVCGLAFSLASYWRFVASKEAFSPVTIENVTTDEPVLDGCCHYNVTMTWQVAALNETRVPSFKIWLTSERKKIGNYSILESGTANESSFQFTFVRLKPSKNYTAHMEAFTSMQNATSYASVSFYVERKIFFRGGFTADLTAELDRYLIVTWEVAKKYRRSPTPITYNISMCANIIPTLCKKEVWTMCSASYNPSTSSGDVQLYEHNWRKYISSFSAIDRPIHQPLLKSWSSQAYLFSCHIYLPELCKELSLSDNMLLYTIDYGNGTYGRVSHRVRFEKGFSYKPDFINVSSIPEPNNPNSITAQVKWRLGIICQQQPAREFNIILKKDGSRQSMKSFNRFNLLTSHQSHVRNDLYVEQVTSFHELTPFSNYTIEFVTEDSRGKSIELETKIFMTPEGVPDSSPTIQPIVKDAYHCVENKRNVTVSWKLPPSEKRNGMIRNVTLKYFPAKNASIAEFVFLPKVKSTRIFGLYCDIEYKVQVRVCVHLERSCSSYSRAQVIYQVSATKAISTENASSVLLWTYVGVGVGVALLLVLVGCVLYVYRRKKRAPLEMLTENVGHPYEDCGKTELSQVGEYDGYYNDEEERYGEM